MTTQFRTVDCGQCFDTGNVLDRYCHQCGGSRKVRIAETIGLVQDNGWRDIAPMTDNRYDFCPLQMINFWWTSWKMMWGWIGAEAGWRDDLFGDTRCEHRYEWEFAEAPNYNHDRPWWKVAYGWS